MENGADKKRLIARNTIFNVQTNVPSSHVIFRLFRTIFRSSDIM